MGKCKNYFVKLLQRYFSKRSWFNDLHGKNNFAEISIHLQ